MSPFARTIILVAALLGLLMTTMAQSPVVVVGDDTIVCVEGYVMDQYCINNVVMIDNGIKTLEQPDKHSVHCLVDVGVCVDSLFEILGDPTTPGEMYTRGFQVDEGADGGAGKERLLDVARTVGNKPGGCFSCYGDGPQVKGFRAVMNATVLEWPSSESSNTPAVIQVHTVFASNDQTSTEVGSTNVQDPCQEMFGMMQTVLGVAAEPPVDPTDENNGNSGGDGSGAAAMTTSLAQSWIVAVLKVAIYAAGI